MAHTVVHSNRLCRNVVTYQVSGLRIGSGGVRDVAVLCLVYLVINSTKHFRHLEININEVQDWCSENYMYLRVLVIFPFYVRHNAIHCTYQIDVVEI
jgi:hypothetical protein